jgi:hypothetical protein
MAGVTRGRRWLLVLALWLVPAPGDAELYQCPGPDGKPLYTSDRSQCPGALAHEPKGSVQRSAPNAPRGREVGARRLADDEAEAQVWRAKRASAEAELRQAETQLATLREVAGWCNRGREVWAQDADGLRRDVDCEEVDSAERALRREHRRLEAYLAEGLEDECRRAGCLPGWVRE